MLSAVWGRVLVIDLTNSKVSVEKIPEEVFKTFIGGKGLATYLLLKHSPPNVDGFDPRNPIVMATGPLTGLLSENYMYVVAKSPLTNRFIESICSGKLPLMIKRAGYDAVVIKGRASKPVYLWIKNDHVEIRRAFHLWNKGTFTASQEILRETSSKASVSVIGIAGINLVRIANVLNDFIYPWGRGGFGTLYGAKYLKGLAVYGNREIKPYDAEGLKKSYIKYLNLLEIKPNLAFPLRNYRVREKLSNVLNSFNRELLNRLEDVIMMGFNLGFRNEGEVAELLWLTDDLGIDPVSFGNILGWMIEGFEEGWLDEKKTAGLKPIPTTIENVRNLALHVAERFGFGAILAEGVDIASYVVNHESMLKAVHVRGLETGAIDPGCLNGIEYSYILSDSSLPIDLYGILFEEKLSAKRFKVIRDKVNLILSLPVPPYILVEPENLLYYATGYEPQDILVIGERIEKLVRTYSYREGNLLEGWSTLPFKWKQYVEKGKLESFINEYYNERDWVDSKPTKKSLRDIQEFLKGISLPPLPN